MTELRQHSKTAWTIASAYSDVLASETRDLAANIDFALAEERKRCNEGVVKFTEKEVQTVKDLINDWGWEYALKANRDDVVALARKLELHKLADDLTV